MNGNSNRVVILIGILVGSALLYIWAQSNNPQLASQLEQLARQLWELLTSLLWTVVNFLLDMLASALRMLTHAIRGFAP
jgi:hypothetical protein